MIDREASQWPPPWRLSAPESHVLDHRGGANRDVPFRLAVKELVARGVLAAHPIEGGWLRGPPYTYSLTDGRRISHPVAPLLEPALAAYRAGRRRTRKALRDGSEIDGVPMSELLRAGRRQLGGTERYLDIHVGPALVERGLLEPTGTRGLRRRPTFDWTPAGRESEQLLQEWLALGQRNVARWGTSDLTNGAEFITRAGSAVLLLDGYQPQLARLGQRVQAIAAGTGGDGIAPGWDGGTDHGPYPEIDGLELDLSSLSDLSALATDVGDLGGFGDGGGGGGGDGGGGG